MWGRSPCPLPALSLARLWREPGLSLEAEIPGAGIQAVLDKLQLRWGKKPARQESCLGSALKFWPPRCSSNTSACQKGTPSWPGACILLPNPHLFPFLSDNEKCICLDTGQTIAKCVTRQCPRWLNMRPQLGSLLDPSKLLSAYSTFRPRGVA